MRPGLSALLAVLTMAAAWLHPRSPDAAMNVAPVMGTIALVSDPEAASVFLDGRYVGETGTEGPLVISMHPGTCQLRVGARKHADLVTSVKFEAGRRRKLRAELAPWGKARGKSPPSILISVGHVLRGILTEKDGDQAQKSRGLMVDSFEFRGLRGQKRNLVLHVGQGVEFAVRAADGREIRLEAERHPPGNPPDILRRRFAVDRDGVWTVLVRVRHGGAAIPYIFGFEKAIPPVFQGKTPRGEPRLVPGVPEKPPGTDRR